MIRRVCVLAAAVTALALTPSAALAVGPAAEALFEDGRRLLAEGKIGEACARFSESYAIEASSGTLLNLALCHERLGNTATAWSEYQAAARLAREQGRGDRAAVADEKAAALEPRLARLTAVPTKVVPGMVIATDAGTVGEGRLGVPVPIDPGVHHVTVSAPGYRSWTTIIELQAGEQQTLSIPDLGAIPLPGVASSAESSAVLVDGSETPAERNANVEMYLAGSGAFLLVGGVAAWSAAYIRFQSAKEACNTLTGCSEDDRRDRVSTIETLQRAAIGSLIAGAGLLVAAGVHSALHRERASATVAIDPVNRGLAFRATF